MVFYTISVIILLLFETRPDIVVWLVQGHLNSEALARLSRFLASENLNLTLGRLLILWKRRLQFASF